MTDTPAINQDPDTDETRTLRREMVTALVNDGMLTDDRWCHAFLAVPRHVLVPAYYQASEQIDGQTDRERWLRLVYSDTTLITQRRHDAVTSSGTMPSLVAMMLQALEVEEGHRVLQVATGTGYTAALLCERLGSEQVTSIDVDPDLTTAARDRLRRCGYTPNVIAADGAHGYPDHAPYDRIIVTFAVTGIPPAWIDHTRAGGIILAPVFSAWSHSRSPARATHKDPSSVRAISCATALAITGHPAPRTLRPDRHATTPIDLAGHTRQQPSLAGGLTSPQPATVTCTRIHVTVRRCPRTTTSIHVAHQCGRPTATSIHVRGRRL